MALALTAYNRRSRPLGGGTIEEITPSLPSNRAFVVQLHATAGQAAGDFAGRVEHMASGQVARFSSTEELRAY